MHSSGLCSLWTEVAFAMLQEAVIPPIPPPPQMDPNRAFQAHNLETLEAALVQANLAFPPQQVKGLALHAVWSAQPSGSLWNSTTRFTKHFAMSSTTSSYAGPAL